MDLDVPHVLAFLREGGRSPSAQDLLLVLALVEASQDLLLVLALVEAYAGSVDAQAFVSARRDPLAGLLLRDLRDAFCRRGGNREPVLGHVLRLWLSAPLLTGNLNHRRLALANAVGSVLAALPGGSSV